MNIRKNSFLWKMAYGSWGELDREIKTTNLCKFFWRFVAAFFIVIPLIYIIGFFVAHGPDTKGILRPYRKWPKIKGHHVYPITVFLIFVVALGIVRLGMYIGMYNLIFGTSIIVGIVVLMIVVLWFIASSFQTFRESDTFQLVRSYIRAKKDKVCPTITFID
jgi:MFS family permease